MGGSNETMGRAEAHRRGGRRAGREGGQRERGGVRRGYTPEPVYGQRCESPHLTSGAGVGGSLSHKVAVYSICLSC